MCSIIGFTGKAQNIRQQIMPGRPDNYISFFRKLLDQKGSGEYVILMKTEHGMISEITSLDEIPNDGRTFSIFEELISRFYNILYSLDSNVKCDVLMFRRMAPEMEDKQSLIMQPYYNKDLNQLIAVHGTIPKAEQLKDVVVDTDIFATGDFTENIDYVEYVGGKIAVIMIDDGDVYTYENGLGMFSYYLNSELTIYTNIHLDGYNNLRETSVENSSIGTENQRLQMNSKEIVSLFSSGLDITCSTYKAIDKAMQENYDTMVHLWYFDWGTNASKQEIENGKQFAKIIEEKYQECENFGGIQHTVIKVKKMFQNVLDACDVEVRLSNKNAKGKGKVEAEGDISYVPFRNTLLLTLAAAKAEQLFPNQNVDFILGANLSEGMIYLDNSETFVRAMNDVVKVGGQKCYGFDVIAPFVNKTKTEMLKEFVIEMVPEGNLELSRDFSSVFSCYFPTKKGKECGKCGSCLLKQKAFQRALKED